MMLEYAINRDEMKILNHALSEEKTVEWIARFGFGLWDCEDMSLIDDQQHDIYALQEIRKITEFEAEQKLAQSYLDGHLPEACHARMQDCFWRGDRLSHIVVKRPHTGVQQSN